MDRPSTEVVIAAPYIPSSSIARASSSSAAGTCGSGKDASAPNRPGYSLESFAYSSLIKRALATAAA
ncbi:Uncharacterised protein [Mycobacteroides abscessus subsp. abscessus]|nr:Uncharacterised protein [Mycobacteroides abscessus subsp. abscessus]